VLLYKLTYFQVKSQRTTASATRDSNDASRKAETGSSRASSATQGTESSQTEETEKQTKERFVQHRLGKAELLHTQQRPLEDSSTVDRYIKLYMFLISLL
jgi:hypothetical protein